MIPLVDLKAQYASIKHEIDPVVLEVLASGQFALGPEVARFEQEFAAFCNAKHGIAVNSGTSALHLALLAAGVGPGDEVITVPFTFIATVAAIRYTGATPVFVDIAPHNHTIDVSQVAATITKKTKAIIPVHLYGQPADLDPLCELARRHQLTVIEDASQAHGAEYRDQRVGGVGEFGCFSFYPGKNLGAYGEGGFVVTNDTSYAQTIRSLRSWAEEPRHHHARTGFNYRMDNLQGAILRIKLRHLTDWTNARRQIAATYDKVLADTSVTVPIPPPHTKHVYHQYVVQTERRDALHQVLKDQGIQTGLYYPLPLHLQPCYADLGGTPGDYPCAEAAARTTLALPVYPELPRDVPHKIAKIVQRCLSALSV